MKFDNEFLERLYSETPDAQCGDSSCGSGWYGLYIAPFNVGRLPHGVSATLARCEAVIIYERTDGICEADYFTDIDYAMTHWRTCESVADMDEWSIFEPCYV